MTMTGRACSLGLRGGVVRDHLQPGLWARPRRRDQPGLSRPARGRHAKRDRALRPQLVECALCGGPDVVTTCESGVCGIEPAPIPTRDVSWSWANPIAATTIPTDTIFAGVIAPGTDPAQELTVTLAVEGEDAPRAVTIRTDTARCARSGCPSALDVGPPLPPHANIAFHFAPSSGIDDISWTTGDGDDVTAPSVVPFTLIGASVAKGNVFS